MNQAKLEEFNPWWITGAVDLELALPFKRDVFQEVEQQVNKRFIIALTGLRRVGKTTILYQMIQDLIHRKISPTNILFFSFDDLSAELSEILDMYKELHAKDFRNEKCYIFLDEVQKYANWENELKKYYDLYPKLKFIISGSESLFIKRKTKETLAGRIFEFVLTPFTFKEYLTINNVLKEEFKYESKIKPFFIKFAQKGGFPETFSFDSERDFKEYVKALVVDKIIYRDIPKMFKIEDPEFLGVLLELIATNPGMYLDYFSLSKQFEKDRRVIKNYVSYLKECFLIVILGNYRRGSITTLRKIKRAYPTDNALSAIYKSKIDEAFLGRMIETLMVNKLKATSFWKNGSEIDIIHNGIPVEIKYQEKINPEDYKPLKEFMRKFNQSQGILITKTEEKEIQTEAGKITLIPAWKFLLKKV
jgi:predicted AAA+ superfamily ATPase